MTEVKTFEEARKLSIDKWEKVLRELNKTEEIIGDKCGFCLLANYELQQKKHLGYKCYYCLAENKCKEYKKVTMSTFQKYKEWINILLRWLDNLEEKDTTSRYLEK